MEQELSFGSYRLDPEGRQLWKGTQLVRLRPKALAVLSQLVQQSGHVVSKEELFHTVWAETVVSDASLSVCIRELRRALRDDAKEPRYIETVHRRGFRFIGKVVRNQKAKGKRQKQKTLSQPMALNTQYLLWWVELLNSHNSTIG